MNKQSLPTKKWGMVPAKLAYIAALVLAVTMAGSGLAAASASPVIPHSMTGSPGLHAALTGSVAPSAGVACSSGVKAFMNNVPEELVDTWDSSLDIFVARTSGHTDLCLINPQVVGGYGYTELEAYGIGNDCVSAPGGKFSYVELNGCKAGQKDELWTDIAPSGAMKSLDWGTVIEADGNGANMYLNTYNNGNYFQDWILKSG